MTKTKNEMGTCVLCGNCDPNCPVCHETKKTMQKHIEQEKSQTKTDNTNDDEEERQ